MKMYYVYDPEITLMRGFICKSKQEAECLQMRLCPSASDHLVIIEMDTDDDFKRYILSGGSNWLVILDTIIGRLSVEPCIYEANPGYYDSVFQATIRADCMNDAVQAIYSQYIVYCAEHCISPAVFSNLSEYV